jgi:hypothetical protein
MPNRILKSSHCTSKTLSKLETDWGAIVLFDRLIVTADDFGRFVADTCIIRAACYPRLLDKVTDNDVEGWLIALARVGLIQLYTVNDTRYGALCKWDNHQRQRNQKSRFPSPPTDNLLPIDANCQRVAATRGLTPDSRLLTTDTDSDIDTPPAPASPDAEAKVVLDWFYGLWKSVNGRDYPKSAEPYMKAKKAAERLLKDKPAAQSVDAFLASLRSVALSALRGEYLAATPGTLAAFVAGRGKYTDANRKGGAYVPPPPPPREDGKPQKSTVQLMRERGEIP